MMTIKQLVRVKSHVSIINSHVSRILKEWFRAHSDYNPWGRVWCPPPHVIWQHLCTGPQNMLLELTLRNSKRSKDLVQPHQRTSKSEFWLNSYNIWVLVPKQYSGVLPECKARVWRGVATVNEFRLLQQYFAFLLCVWHVKFKKCLQFEPECTGEASFLC